MNRIVEFLTALLAKGRTPDKKKSLDWRYAPETVFSLTKKGLIR